MSDGVLLTSDLFFSSKVTGTASQLGYEIRATADANSAADLCQDGPVQLLILDLATPGLQPDAIMSSLTGSKPKVIAFGSHIDAVRLQAARDAGCDDVMPRSRFSAELPAILQSAFTDR